MNAKYHKKIVVLSYAAGMSNTYSNNHRIIFLRFFVLIFHFCIKIQCFMKTQWNKSLFPFKYKTD